jgi:predicted Zn-dependent protease
MHSDEARSVQGRYSDGQTAQSVPAEVRLTGRGIEVGFPGAPQALVWPYGALGVATPLTSKSADALVTYAHMPGATLFIADAATVQQLMKLAPQITSRAYGWRSARPWIIAAACVVLAFVGLWLAELSPARWVAAMLPDRIRGSVGDQVVTSMVGSRKECTEPAGRAALDDLVERLSKASGTGTRFRVRVVDWGLLNAFAVPGEQIVLTRRIITDAKSPEEVAGVLAHEMGHGLELHPETSIVRVIGLTAALELMTGGGGAIANIGLGLTQLSYTRTAEREADARGLALLQRSEIAASGLIDFFKRIGEIERKSSGSREWNIFRTHPQSEERAKAAAARPTYPTRPALDAQQWQALRTICGTPRPAADDEKNESKQ